MTTVGEAVVVHWRRGAGMLALMAIPLGCCAVALALKGHPIIGGVLGVVTLGLIIGFATTWFRLRWFLGIVRKRN